MAASEVHDLLVKTHPADREKIAAIKSTRRRGARRWAHPRCRNGGA